MSVKPISLAINQLESKFLQKEIRDYKGGTLRNWSNFP